LKIRKSPGFDNNRPKLIKYVSSVVINPLFSPLGKLAGRDIYFADVFFFIFSLFF